MFNAEVRDLLVQVVSSWQVIAVTIVLVIFISIVNHVAKLNRDSSVRRLLMPKSKPGKKPKKEAPAHSDSDELELDEDPTTVE